MSADRISVTYGEWESHQGIWLTAVKVAGRNNVVTKAMTFITALSRAAAKAIDFESDAIELDMTAIWRLRELSCCDRRL